ncbi:dynamin family protein [Desulfonema magnum]|uniref:dynamin family protein n=1 Tax=Desulfonema magnum TaxID=45655 RepID=UPI001A9A75DF|nr:dynamin family protein [Desulfonema magnum]
MFSNVKTIPGMNHHSFNGWEKTCDNIHQQLSEEVIRVAVVGPIKSGKSTFVNSLFNGDYLKRGAGVVTSIVTRIRRGQSLKASLCFKSYDDINADIEQAMVLLPSLNRQAGDHGFDIRKKEDRETLEQALGNLKADLLISNDTRNMNSVLLTSYLEGYEKVKDVLSSDTVIREYEGDSFAMHKDFVGDDTLAVYLRDVQLEIHTGEVDSNIEIADCQGSDSPNPLHLAMIQDYLLLTHLIVYVISSRTGVRQADIKFLSIIKKMGIIDNILFVINFDFNEHESEDDLNALVEKIRAEVSLIKPDPEIYTLSGLFNLFSAKKSRSEKSDSPESDFNPAGFYDLSPKDSLRLAQWEKEKAFSDLSAQETKRFESYFNHKLTTERYALLCKNHLERLGVISSGVEHWIHINTDILSGDAHNANEMIKKIKRHQKKMNQIKAMTETTLNGTVKKVRHTVKADIDRFFDTRSGIFTGVVGFIRNYNVSYYDNGGNSVGSLASADFSNSMYLMFQEFKQAVDSFMAETINPDIIRFIKEEEKKIRESLESVAEPYEVMVQEALDEYNKIMERFQLAPIQGDQHKIELPDTELIKQTTELKFPPMAASMRYSAKIKTEAIMHFGFYTAVRLIKKLFKKPVENEAESSLALKKGVSRLKQETEKATAFHFKDYRENIKFQYVFRLVEAFSTILYDILLDRLHAHTTDISEIVNLINKKQIDKHAASQLLKDMELASRGINTRIETLREKMEISDIRPN